MVRQDNIDILVDLSGHTGTNRLPVFARKPAPVQVTYLGYPNTTGLSTIDYRLTDAWADPPGKTERWHTETLIRLPHGFLCYRPPNATPAVAPPPVQANGHITFGSFNSLVKTTPAVVACWAHILQQVPDARLVIKNKSFRDPSVCARYQGLFAEHGIAPERLELVGWIDNLNNHLELYHRLDIALDPFPYNGTTTTCEALWMGVPVITLAGHTHAGRVGVSLLSRLDLTDLIAGDPDDYTQRAVRLAQDRATLARLRPRLRPRLQASSLCDGPAFARDVEAAYREMWRGWCGGVKRDSD
jgi:predicted O-linked N-acetylglucosamine transferase (SPINDLY family)